MKGTSILTGTLWALLLGAAAAPAPVSEVDAHVAAARAAAGQDYSNNSEYDGAYRARG